jgi:hypothetical protein
MEIALKKGNVCVLKRPLADFLCVVHWVDGDDVSIRYLDSPKEVGYNVVKRDELIKLAEDQEKELPQDFLSAVDRQRQIVFSPKKSQKSLASLLRNISAEKEDEIFRILLADGQQEEEVTKE